LPVNQVFGLESFEKKDSKPFSL